MSNSKKIKETTEEVITEVKDEVGEAVESVLENFEESEARNNAKVFGVVAGGATLLGALGFGVYKLVSKIRGRDLECDLEYPDHPEE